MKDSNKKLLITILNIVIMVANAIITYITKDSAISNISIGAMALTGVNTCFLG